MAALLAAITHPVAGQTPPQLSPPQGHMSREALAQALAHLEDVSVSLAHTSRDRTRALHEAALIRTRLQEGDFHVGDRIHLVVEGEAALSDTFAVATGRVLNLPGLEPIPMAGVLRFELEDHLRGELARFIREPSVRARSTIRIAITGEVSSQGFFVLPTDVVLSDALMAAGGPTAGAKLDGIRIMRGRDVLWSPEPMADAMRQGRTLDQLNLRAGDQVTVPGRTSGVMNLVTTLSVIVPVITVVAALLL
jgi:protein involved in polysaccharide export with SLBB domain